jgi:elongation factor P hydroxylase
MRTIIVNNKIEERYETELNQAKDLNLFVPNNKKAVFDASLFNFDYYLDENSNNVIKQEIYSGGYHFELLSKRIK